MLGSKGKRMREMVTIGSKPILSDSMFDGIDEIAVKGDKKGFEFKGCLYGVPVGIIGNKELLGYPTELLIMNINHTRTNVVNIIDIAAHQEQVDTLRTLSNMESDWKMPMDLMCNFGNQVLKILDERRIRTMLGIEEDRYLMPIEDMTPILPTGGMSVYIGMGEGLGIAKELIEELKRKEDGFARDLKISINRIESANFREQKLSGKSGRNHQDSKNLKMEARLKQRIQFHGRGKR